MVIYPFICLHAVAPRPIVCCNPTLLGNSAFPSHSLTWIVPCVTTKATSYLFPSGCTRDMVCHHMYPFTYTHVESTSVQVTSRNWNPSNLQWKVNYHSGDLRKEKRKKTTTRIKFWVSHHWFTLIMTIFKIISWQGNLDYTSSRFNTILKVKMV